MLAKPDSMSTREWLLRASEEKTKIDRRIIEKVISHQFDGASSALSDNNTIEISGFGKFIFNEKRAHATLKHLINKKAAEELALSDVNLTEEKRIRHSKRLAEVNKNINLLKTKCYE